MKGAYLLTLRGQKHKMIKEVEAETKLLNLLNYTVYQKLKWISHSNGKKLFLQWNVWLYPHFKITYKITSSKCYVINFS